MTVHENSKTMMGFIGWFKERFPPINIFSAFLLYYFMYAFLIRQNMTEGFGIREFLLPIGILSQLLLLRILDEFKDNEFDRKHHPDRILQKGVIKVQDLKGLLISCIIIQIVINIFLGKWLNLYWAAMLIWSLLMYKEFFIENWLRKHLFIYLISHMIVMPLMCVWIFSFYTEDFMRIWPAVSVIFWGSVLFEICRKSRGLDENQNLDSYAKVLGYKLNSLMLFILSFFVASSILLCGMNHQIIRLILMVASFLFIAAIVNHYKKRKANTRKKLEGAYGLFMLAVYVGYILEIFLLNVR